MKFAFGQNRISETDIESLQTLVVPSSKLGAVSLDNVVKVQKKERDLRQLTASIVNVRLRFLPTQDRAVRRQILRRI